MIVAVISIVIIAVTLTAPVIFPLGSRGGGGRSAAVTFFFTRAPKNYFQRYKVGSAPIWSAMSISKIEL